MVKCTNKKSGEMLFMKQKRIEQSWDSSSLPTVLQVLELVNFCSSRIFESLSEDNALEIGMFGEMHNSEVNIIKRKKGGEIISVGAD